MTSTNTSIRRTTASDSAAISEAVRAAFGAEGPEIDQLITNLLEDASAKPIVSLVAESESTIVGHVLFTRVEVVNSPRSVSAQILAPLAVVPGFQGQGIGGRLIEKGLNELASIGTDIVFVLGHPGYYRKHGFEPAGMHGFEAPHPIPAKDAEAWMVRELIPGSLVGAGGRVVCANSLMDPKYWRE